MISLRQAQAYREAEEARLEAERKIVLLGHTVEVFKEYVTLLNRGVIDHLGLQREIRDIYKTLDEVSK